MEAGDSDIRSFNPGSLLSPRIPFDDEKHGTVTSDEQVRLSYLKQFQVGEGSPL